MKHETPTIKARLRERVGTRYARRLRSQGRLPAVIYGHRQEPISVSVDEKETLGHLYHGAHVINVEIENGPSETCLVKDLQFGYLGDNVVHIDFARVDLEEEVTVNIHLHFVGTPKEAQKAGAIVNHDLTELEVICKVTDIPDEIRVDLSQMKGNALTVGELVLPENVRAADTPDTRVASISFVHEEEEAVGEEAAVAGEEGAEPEVISEARRKEEEEESD